MMKQQTRPRRQKKADRLIHPDARKIEIECYEGTAPFDRMARAMDLKWGVDRLPELVSPETASRYGVTLGNLNAALAALVPADVIACVHSCLRGMTYMDAEAEAAGQPHASPDVLEAEIDGYRFGILPDPAFWPAAQAARPDLRLFTMREIAVLLKSLNTGHAIIEEAKKIGGAEIVAIRDKAATPLPSSFWNGGGDPIPEL